MSTSKQTASQHHDLPASAPPAHEPVLQMKLLGSLAIQLGEKQLTNVGSKKALALLCYLSVTKEPVSREVLTALFWPEMTESAAKNNLRSTLTMLRKHLGPYLVITSTTIAFQRQRPYQLDVEQLRIAITKTLAAPNLQALQDAIDRYCGEFLSGFYLNNANLFEEWLLQQREQLHLLVLRALETLVTRAIDQGNYAIGIDAGQKLLAMEPWSETAHRQLMTIFALNGQRGRALQQYSTCCRLLANELDVEPMPETTALYRQIQAGQLAPRPLPVAQPAAIEHRRASLPAALPASATAIPAPASSCRVPNNLFTPLATFIGRQTELTHLTEQLVKSECRLLTICGPGGVGKSSLALALGQRLLTAVQPPFVDGIFFVPLAGVDSDRAGAGQVSNPDQQPGAYPIITAIAEAVGYPLQGGRAVHTQLLEYLQPRRLLLILDNFEQLAPNADMLATLLNGAPTVTLLVTSRTRLNLRSEMLFPLNGLSLSSPVAVPTRHPSTENRYAAWPASDAMALFVERAQNLNPDFVLDAKSLTPITQICQAVAGLPLAIEMTAAWTTVYSCDEIAAQLTPGKPVGALLTSQFQDQLERHQSLQQVFDDSWALLPPPVQLAMAKVSVFSGQFPRGAAQTIAGLTVTDLVHLRDHSLLQVDEGYRYALHPLIREFAAAKWLELTVAQPHARDRLRQAHSDYYLQRIAGMAQHPNHEADFVTIHTSKQDHAEIVRAWQWALQQHNRHQIQQTMAGIFRYLEVTNQSMEGKLLFGLPYPAAQDPIAWWLQVAECHFLRRLAEYDEARRRLDTILTTVSPLVAGGESRGQSNATGQADTADNSLIVQTHTFALCVLGWINYEQGHYALAHHCFATAHDQAERIGAPIYLLEAHNGLGAVAFSRKEYASTLSHYEAALSHATQQADLHYTAIILGNLAAHAQATGASANAERYLRMRLAIDQKTQNGRQMAISYQRLGQAALLDQSYPKAEIHLRKSLALFEQVGHSPEIAHVLLDLSNSLLRQRRVEEAEQQCLRSLQLAMQSQMIPRILAALTQLAEIRIDEERKEEALILLQMVNRSVHLPAATWRKAQKLQEMLRVELGSHAVVPLPQPLTRQAINEFGVNLLLYGNTANATQFSMGGSDSSSMY